MAAASAAAEGDEVKRSGAERKPQGWKCMPYIIGSVQNRLCISLSISIDRNLCAFKFERPFHVSLVHAPKRASV